MGFEENECIWRLRDEDDDDIGLNF